jgi:hypothetical protein
LQIELLGVVVGVTEDKLLEKGMFNFLIANGAVGL